MKKLDEPEIHGSFVCPNVPEAEGIYVITSADASVLYVGSSKGLRRRAAYILGNLYDSDRGGYLDDASEPLLAFQTKGETATIHYLQCSDAIERAKALKAKYDPPWNKYLPSGDNESI
jgi:excinuclease UvrABC nuclease subunit